MNNKRFEDKKLSLATDKIYHCIKKDGKMFCSKLIDIDGDNLLFVTKGGRLILNKLSTIESMIEVA